MHLSKFKPRNLSTPINLSRFKRFYIGSAQFQTHFSQSLSIHLCLFTSQTHFSHSILHSQEIFSLKIIFFHLGWSIFTHSIMHFMFSELTFGIFDKLWSFSKLMEFLWNFWDGLCENGFHHALQHICIITLFHAF